ncbi:MAG: hypothetical protein R2771_14295 [Saprospiraceae bacterium]
MFLNDGNADFSQQTGSLILGNGRYSYKMTDIDEDGDLDLFYLRSDGVICFAENGGLGGPGMYDPDAIIMILTATEDDGSVKPATMVSRMEMKQALIVEGNYVILVIQKILWN